MRLAVRQHLHALDDRGHEIVYHNAYERVPAWLRWLRPDGVVLHPTFLGIRWNDDFSERRTEYAWVRGLRCPKLALPQDEYDHAALLEEWLAELGATAVFSCFGSEQRAILYPRLTGRTRFIKTLTGYVDDHAAREIAGRQRRPDDRPFDLVYRAAQLPYWFGSHGQLKHRIASIVDERARSLGLRTDISTSWERMIFGKRWLDFVMSGRATIGCESGSSVLDRRGHIQRRIRALLEAEPELTFEEVDRRMPDGWDAYAFFAVSPRHLEAVVTKTCQMLVEGHYDGILEPNVHYIPLRRDFSNLDQALERIRDIDAAAQMAETAYEDVYLRGGHTLDRFAAELEAAMGQPRRRHRPPIGALVRASRPLDAIARGRAALVHRNRSPSGFRVQATLLLLFVHTVITNRPLRHVTVRALNARPRPPLRRVVGDIVRLRVLAGLRAGRFPLPAGCTIAPEREDHALVFRSAFERRAEGVAVASDADVEVVTWDHSAVGTAVPLLSAGLRWGGIPLGSDGRYEFTTLAGSRQLRREALLAVGVESAQVEREAE